MSKTGKILTIIGIIAAIIAIIAVPSSLYFEEGTDKGTLLWTAAAAAAIAIGFFFVSFLFKAAEPKPRELRLPDMEKPAAIDEKRELPGWLRPVMAIIGLLLAGGVLFIPQSSYFSGSGPDGIWIIGVVAAVALGLGLIRWLLSQGFMKDDDLESQDTADYAATQQLLIEEKQPNYLFWLLAAAVLAIATVMVTITDLGSKYPLISFAAILTAMGAGLILAILATKKMDEIDKRPVERNWQEVHQNIPKNRPAASPAVRWSAFVILALAAGTMIAVPTASFFGEQGEFTIWSFLASGAAMCIGLGLGYWLLRQAMAASERADSAADDEFADEFTTQEPPKERPAWMRHILLILAILLAVFTASVPAAEYYNSGHAYAGGWFLAAMSALAVGALFGYWLKLQAEAAAKAAAAESEGDKFKEDKPFVFPPWTKWVALAGLVILLIVLAVIGSRATYYTGNASSWLEIVMAIGATVVGVGFGIWFTKHYDQMAKDAYELRRQNMNLNNNNTSTSSYNSNSDDKFERK